MTTSRPMRSTKPSSEHSPYGGTSRSTRQSRFGKGHIASIPPGEDGLGGRGSLCRVEDANWIRLRSLLVIGPIKQHVVLLSSRTARSTPRSEDFGPKTNLPYVFLWRGRARKPRM